MKAEAAEAASCRSAVAVGPKPFPHPKEEFSFSFIHFVSRQTLRRRRCQGARDNVQPGKLKQ